MNKVLHGSIACRIRCVGSVAGGHETLSYSVSIVAGGRIKTGINIHGKKTCTTMHQVGDTTTFPMRCMIIIWCTRQVHK